MKTIIQSNKLLKMAFLLIFLFTSYFVQAQEVSGSVNGPDGDALIGVNIIIKGTSTGTTSDIDGNFRISASSEDVLEFSYIGYNTQEVTVGSQTVIDIVMSENASQLDEVVVIGYGSQKKSDVTGAISTVSGEEISKVTTDNATQALQGRMTGVEVVSNGGAPGAGAVVTIRGASTLSNRGPLYVIDGMFSSDMENLNPADIESVTVLKDASASAIYGSRAANGVVIVTTKQGKAGKVAVDVNFNYGSQSPTRYLDWANARQYADIVNKARDNDGDPRFPANDTEFNPNVDSDIQRESIRSSAPMYNAGFRISGGGENATFAFSANQLERTGIVKESDFTRSNMRLNGNYIKGRFKFETAIGLSRTVNNYNDQFNLERDILPTVAIYDDEGNFTADGSPEATPLGQFYGVGNIRNSLGTATLVDRTVTGYDMIGSVAGTFEILEGLFYKLNLGATYGNSNNYRFTPQYFFNGGPGANTPFAELRETNSTNVSPLMEHTLNFKRNLGAHNIDVIAGYTAQKSTFNSLGVVARRFPSNDIRVAGAAEDIAQAPSTIQIQTIVSNFARLNYTFDDRYILTATIRQDQSSLFREDLRRGIFPSVAVGWNVSNESFMSGVTAISDLKIRANYGQIGSNNVAPYSISPQLNLASQYPLGVNGDRATGYSITRGINPNIFWETTTTSGVGLEFAALKNKLYVTADYFVRDSEDVLVNLGLPRYTGFSNLVPFNSASIRNNGFEFLIDYNDKVGDFTYGASVNFSTVRNEVTSLGQATPIIAGGFTSNGLRSTKTDVGAPVASFFGYRVEGIYQSDAEAEAANSAFMPSAGDFKFADLNGDGIIDAEDQEVIGNPAPDFTYGLNLNLGWKNIDASLFFNGVQGNDILNSTLYRGYFDTEGNYLASALDAWTPSNTDTDIPRNSLTDPNFNRRVSDFYLEDGSYFRLRNMQIGYTLDSGIAGKAGMSSARIYVGGQNLFTFTKYTGYYPEVGRNPRRDGGGLFNTGVDENAYPTARLIQVGIQASF